VADAVEQAQAADIVVLLLNHTNFSSELALLSEVDDLVLDELSVVDDVSLIVRHLVLHFERWLRSLKFGLVSLSPQSRSKEVLRKRWSLFVL